jgi:hypothetical protein
MEGSTTFDSLCEACCAIFDENAIRMLRKPPADSPVSSSDRLRKPHLSYKALLASMEKGCHLCKVIFHEPRHSFILHDIFEDLTKEELKRSAANCQVSISIEQIRHGIMGLSVYSVCPGYLPTPVGAVLLSPVVCAFFFTVGLQLT